VFVVDERHHPVGTCQLSWILRTPRNIRLTDVMKRDQTLIPTDMDQEEVALRFQKYALISAAVVDDAGGWSARSRSMISSTSSRKKRARMPCCCRARAMATSTSRSAMPITAACAGWSPTWARHWSPAIIAAFGGAIEQLVALAVLMPIVASIGGNAGTQTMAVTVRASR
jgi:magnesium transporter